MESASRDEADHSSGDSLGGLGKAVIALGDGLRWLIEAAPKLGDDAFLIKSGDRGDSACILANFA